MALMQKVFDYILKNCSIPNPESYKKCLIYRTEHFIRRLGWRVLFFLQKKNDESSDSDSDSDTPPTNYYGFPSPISPPVVPELASFETDLWRLVDSVNFTDHRSNFQKRLLFDLRNIKKCKNIVVPADKTRNYYEVKPERYEELLNNNITANYKKCDTDLAKTINNEARNLAVDINIDNYYCVQVMSNTDAFIYLKDYKPNFENNTKCRPAKPQLGKVSSKM